MSPRPLKVYGCTIQRANDMEECPDRPWIRQVRAFVAAPTQKAAAEAMDISVNHLRNNGVTTGNELEIETAMASPGQVFWRENHVSGALDRVARPWMGQAEAAERRKRGQSATAEAKVRQEEYRAERQAGEARRAETTQASEDWARRLTEEFNVDAHGIRSRDLLVGLNPEKLYQVLVELDGLMRDIGEVDVVASLCAAAFR